MSDAPTSPPLGFRATLEVDSPFENGKLWGGLHAEPESAADLAGHLRDLVRAAARGAHRATAGRLDRRATLRALHRELAADAGEDLTPDQLRTLGLRYDDEGDLIPTRGATS